VISKKEDRAKTAKFQESRGVRKRLQYAKNREEENLQAVKNVYL